jgi:hypothetical protein
MRTAVCRAVLLLCLLLTTEAGAQDRTHLPTIAFASSATADWVTTHENMKYFREANPMLRWLDHKPKAMIAMGTGLDVASYYGWRALTRNRPKLRAAGLYAATAVRTFIAVRNVRILKQHRPVSNHAP